MGILAILLKKKSSKSYKNPLSSISRVRIMKNIEPWEEVYLVLLFCSRGKHLHRDPCQRKTKITGRHQTWTRAAREIYHENIIDMLSDHLYRIIMVSLSFKTKR